MFGMDESNPEGVCPQLYKGILRVRFVYSKNALIKRKHAKLICTPKVRHFWRCIFLWVKEEEKTKIIVQNLKSVL